MTTEERDDLTIKVLQQICEGITSLTERVEIGFDRIGTALDIVNNRLEMHELRLNRVDFMRQIAKHERLNSTRIDIIIRDIAELRERVRLLELHNKT